MDAPTAGARSAAAPARSTAPRTSSPRRAGCGGLLAANKMIIGDLDLPTVLRRIVEAACQLVERPLRRARRASRPTGGWRQFIHVGIDDATARGSARFRQGKGLLGALIDDRRPIRLPRDRRRPAFGRLPAHHPPMASFLGVPIRVRDVGVRQPLPGRGSGRASSAPRTRSWSTALAATAGVAIENARLFAAGRAPAELAAGLHGDHPAAAVDRRRGPAGADRATSVREIADADIVTVVLPTADGERLMVEVAAGSGADELTGFTYPIGELARRHARSPTGEPILVARRRRTRATVALARGRCRSGPVMVVPLVGTRPRAARSSSAGCAGGTVRRRPTWTWRPTFANHAAVALELADARADQQRVVLLEDRDRIARDLHDHVIQRLFAAGLTVQGIAGETPASRRVRSRCASWSTTSTTRSARSAPRSSSCAARSGRETGTHPHPAARGRRRDAPTRSASSPRSPSAARSTSSCPDAVRRRPDRRHPRGAEQRRPARAGHRRVDVDLTATDGEIIAERHRQRRRHRRRRATQRAGQPAPAGRAATAGRDHRAGSADAMGTPRHGTEPVDGRFP